MSFQDFKAFKLYFLRMLFGWSVVLNGDKNLRVFFLDFVDSIMDKSPSA